MILPDTPPPDWIELTDEEVYKLALIYLNNVFMGNYKIENGKILKRND